MIHTNVDCIHAEFYESELSAAIDHLTAAGLNADGNVESISGDTEPSHESRVDLVLRISGYSPRQELAEALAKALLAVWGSDSAGLLLDTVRREQGVTA